MSGSPTPLSLADGFRLSSLSYPDLWHRYLALGGGDDLTQLRHHVESDDCPDIHDHNVIAQALNDAFTDIGHDHPVAYRNLYQRSASDAE